MKRRYELGLGLLANGSDAFDVLWLSLDNRIELIGPATKGLPPVDLPPIP